MTAQRITKRTVDALKSNGTEFTVWDHALTGFGVRVRPTGAKSYVVVYRAGSGRGAPVRRYTIAAVGKITPESARARAKVILGAVAHGRDPADQKSAERGTPTVAELADRFMADHVKPKCKGRTAEFYRDILDRIVKPAVGSTKADKLTRLQVGRLHSSLSATPFQANRVLAVVGSMYTFAARAAIVPERHESGARDIQVQGKSARSLPNRRGAGTAGQRDPRGRDNWHPVDRGRIQTHCQAPAEGQAIHQDCSVCCGGAPAASLHRLSPQGNPALAVGARRF